MSMISSYILFGERIYIGGSCIEVEKIGPCAIWYFV